jgi:hypothetical protein
MFLAGCGSPDAESGGTAAQGTTPNREPVLKADPNPVPKADKLGKTKITWSTGDGSWGQVYLSVNGGEEKLFKQDRSGSAEAAWIGKKGTFEFRLYSGTDRKRRLASVTVTMEK